MHYGDYGYYGHYKKMKYGSSNGRSLSIVKWKGETLTQDIEGDILMIADLYGDWREEIITALPGEIRIYTTNLPAKDRRTTLMQDGIYRSYVAHRSMGYPQEIGRASCRERVFRAV